MVIFSLENDDNKFLKGAGSVTAEAARLGVLRVCFFGLDPNQSFRTRPL